MRTSNERLRLTLAATTVIGMIYSTPASARTNHAAPEVAEPRAARAPVCPISVDPCQRVSGTPTEIAWFDAPNSVTSDPNLFWDNVNKFVGIGTNAPQARLHAIGASGNWTAQIDNTNPNGIAVLGENIAAPGTGIGDALDGLTSQANGFGTWGINLNATGTGGVGSGNGSPAYYLTAGSGGAFSGTRFGTFAYGTAAGGTGSIAAGNFGPVFNLAGSGGSFTGTSGVYGRGTQATTGVGVRGDGATASSDGVIGVGGLQTPFVSGIGSNFFTGATHGAFGLANQPGSPAIITIGLRGLTTGGIGTTSTGVTGVGNGQVTNVVVGGSGGAFTGYEMGSLNIATNTTVAVPAAPPFSTGVQGTSNNLQSAVTNPAGPGILVSAQGSGGSFRGLNNGSITIAEGALSTGVRAVGNRQNGTAGFGSFAMATGSGIGAVGATTGGAFRAATIGGVDGEAVYTERGIPAINTVRVNARVAGIDYKIISAFPALVSMSVPDADGQMRVMHAPETPEALLQDYGQGQLVMGRAHIELDPIFAKNIIVNHKHPLRAFVSLEGDCNGVYITNKTATGFDVVELRGGASNVSFQWSVTANLADRLDAEGNVISKFSDLRFEPAPAPAELAPSDETLLPLIEDSFQPVPADSVTTQQTANRNKN